LEAKKAVQLNNMNISVCICTYNGSDYIRQQLDSILIQLRTCDEVIISDDGSSDNTTDIIKDYLVDGRIRLLEHENFGHPMLNFEYALKQCKGEVIFLSDQDDIWMPNKVSRILPLLEQFDLVVSDCSVVDKDEHVLHGSFFYMTDAGSGFFKNLYKNRYLGCCMAFKKDLLCVALPFPRSIGMHDLWLGMIGEVFGETNFFSEKLIKYRRHSCNVSATSEKSKNVFLKKIHLRLSLVSNLFLRILRESYKKIIKGSKSHE